MVEGNKYILIAEHDDDDRYLFQSAFNEIDSSIKLVFVSNGTELEEHFHNVEAGEISGLPALMVVDIDMHIRNRKNTVRDLLAKQYSRDFPTVFLTATSCEYEEKKRIEMGVHYFFEKPGDNKTLLDILQTMKSIAKL